MTGRVRAGLAAAGRVSAWPAGVRAGGAARCPAAAGVALADAVGDATLAAPARLSAAGFPAAVVGPVDVVELAAIPMAIPVTAARVAAPTPSVSRDGLVMRRFFVNSDRRVD